MEGVSNKIKTEKHVIAFRKRWISMKIIKNQKGIALMTALLLTLVTLAVIMAVFYLINRQTNTSAAQKVYTSALQAAYGDSDIFIKDLLPMMFPYVDDPLKDNSYWENNFTGIDLKIASTSACMNDKLKKDTVDWSNCPTGSTSTDATAFADTTIMLKGVNTNYKVYSKIIDTIKGNTDSSGNSDRYSSADGSTGKGGNNLDGKRVPFVYTVEIQAEAASSALGNKPGQEKAMLEVLYAY